MEKRGWNGCLPRDVCSYLGAGSKKDGPGVVQYLEGGNLAFVHPHMPYHRRIYKHKLTQGRAQRGGVGGQPHPEGEKSKNYTIFEGRIHPHLCLHLPLTKGLDYKYTSELRK